MKKICRFLSMTLILSLLLTGCSSANKDEVKAEDKSISEENKKNEEVRTVAGTVAILDMLEMLDVDIVGRPSTKHELAERYEGVAEIGRPMEPDMEKIKELDPDIFISVDSLKEALAPKLENSDIESIFLDTKSYEGVLESMESLGKLYGKEELVEKYRKEVESEVEAVVKKAEKKEPLRVMVLFGTPKSITYATDKSFIGSLLKKLNCENVVNELENYNEPYVPVNMENILELQPDIILRLTHANPEESRKMFEEEFENNDIWKDLDAVKENKVYDLDNKFFGVSGNAKIGQAIAELGRLLYK